MRFAASVEVADHHARDDRRPARTEPLEHAEGEQHWEIDGERRTERADRENDERNAHDALAPDGIGERAVEHAHAREGDEIQARHLLHRGRVGVEVAPHRREAREDHVDRERAEHREQGHRKRETEGDLFGAPQVEAERGRLGRDFLDLLDRAGHVRNVVGGVGESDLRNFFR